MIKKVIAMLFIASSLVYASEVSSEESLNSFQSKNWDVGVFAGLIFEGDDGDYLEDASGGMGLHIGYRYSDSWSVIFEVSRLTDEADNYGDLVIVDYVIGTTYDWFADDDFFTPYLAIALGYRTISEIDDRDAWNAIPSAGLKFLATDSLQIFLEAKVRFNLEERERGAMGSFGVSYLF